MRRRRKHGHLALFQRPAGTRGRVLGAGGKFLTVIGHLAVLDLNRAGLQFAQLLPLVGGQAEPMLQVDIDIDRKFGRRFYRIAAAAEVCRRDRAAIRRGSWRIGADACGVWATT